MENGIEIDFNICRGCGCRNASILLSTYQVAFKLCTGITVSSSDGFPDKICDKCLKKLKISYSFKVSCLRTEREIRALKNRVMDTFRQCANDFDAGPTYEMSAEGTGDKKEIVKEETVADYLSQSDEEQELHEEFVVYDETLYLDSLAAEENSAYTATKTSETILEIDFVQTSPNGSPTPSVTSHTIRSNAWSKFHCVECQKGFSTKTNLQRHQASHNGKKPFQCNICSKGFTQSGSLKTHRFIHFNIKPHTCSVCNQQFTQKKSLTFHMRRHTGEKPFSCDICKAPFRQKSGLVRHKQQLGHLSPAT